MEAGLFAAVAFLPLPRYRFFAGVGPQAAAASANDNDLI